MEYKYRDNHAIRRVELCRRASVVQNKELSALLVLALFLSVCPLYSFFLKV